MRYLPEHAFHLSLSSRDIAGVDEQILYCPATADDDLQAAGDRQAFQSSLSPADMRDSAEADLGHRIQLRKSFDDDGRSLRSSRVSVRELAAPSDLRHGEGVVARCS